jgi:hypothetical protein
MEQRVDPTLPEVENGAVENLDHTRQGVEAGLDLLRQVSLLEQAGEAYRRQADPVLGEEEIGDLSVQVREGVHRAPGEEVAEVRVAVETPATYSRLAQVCPEPIQPPEQLSLVDRDEAGFAILAARWGHRDADPPVPPRPRDHGHPLVGAGAVHIDP